MVKIVEISINSTKINITGAPSNSLVKWSPDFLVPAIDWDINITVEEFVGGLVKVSVDGEHDGFPGYELSIRKPGEQDFQLIYSYDPIPSGANPHNLSAPMDIVIPSINDKVL